MTRLDPDPLRPPDPPVPHRPHVGCWPLVALGIALTLAWLVATPRSEPNGSLVATGQLTPDKLPAPVHSTRTGSPQGATRDPEPSVGPIATGTKLGDNRSGAPHRGTWAFANPSHGARYLATPEPRGTRIRACGPLGCRTLITNDVGPVLSLQRAGRIGDLSARLFGAICGDLSRGLCNGDYTVLPALPPLPATDEEAK